MSAVGHGIVLRQIDRLFGEGTLTGLGDGQLLERYLSRRDEDAFEAIVDLHGPMVLGLCRRMLRDPRDIEDAFQATFLVLAQKAPGIRDRNLLSNWLYGVAFRVARRARTRTIRRRDREASVGELEVAAEPEPTGRPESDPMLDQELSRLPEKYRIPLVLCYFRGRTHDQAAEELRCPVGTVRSRLARGRELLRKRLIRGGYAPTVPAALLGGDMTLPARLLVANVPPPLVAATVRAALGFGSSSIFKTGAAAVSSVVLAQGVLTTMQVAQLKWIGLAVLVTSLSAGGVVAVGYAAVQTKEGATAKDPVVAPSVDEPKSGQRYVPLRSTEERLQTLEDKIDRLTKSLGAANRSTPTGGAAGTPVGGFEPTPLNTGAGSGTTSRPMSSPPATNPISELETQLTLAHNEYRQINKLFERAVVSASELDKARGKVLIIAAQLDGLDDEIVDEIERLKLEMRRKNKVREKDEAQKEVAAAIVARNERLNKRKPEMVSQEDVIKATGEFKIAEAQIGITEAEIAEVGLRIQQLQRRHDRFKQLAALAQRIKQDTLQGASAAQPDASSVPLPARP
jgi:RNA polymerase sigma factor (sigma-70 family)